MQELQHVTIAAAVVRVGVLIAWHWELLTKALQGLWTTSHAAAAAAAAVAATGGHSTAAAAAAAGNYSWCVCVV